ncbi:MAG TPA: HAMP domain-containing sensor histidine kinase [Candidatus Ozemobacteraceae bacterium]
MSDRARSVIAVLLTIFVGCLLACGGRLLFFERLPSPDCLLGVILVLWGFIAGALFLHHRTSRLFLDLERVNEDLRMEIADRIELEEQLRIARDKAESSNLIRGNIVSNLSHELLTPLNSFLGFTDLLKGQFIGSLNDQQREYLDIMDFNGRHLLSLLDDLLTLSKLDANLLVLTPALIQPSEPAREAVALATARCRLKGITPHLTCFSPLPPLQADAEALKRVLFIFISNLILRPEGIQAVHLTVRHDDGRIRYQAASSPLDMFTADSGFTDIPVQYLHSSPGITFEYSTLSLTLAHRLVMDHGGTIGVRRHPDGRVAFWLALPLTRSASDVPHQGDDRVPFNLPVTQ